MDIWFIYQIVIVDVPVKIAWPREEGGIFSEQTDLTHQNEEMHKG